MISNRQNQLLKTHQISCHPRNSTQKSPNLKQPLQKPRKSQSNLKNNKQKSNCSNCPSNRLTMKTKFSNKSCFCQRMKIKNFSYLTQSSNETMPTWLKTTINYRPVMIFCLTRKMNPSEFQDSLLPNVKMKLAGLRIWSTSSQNKKLFLNWNKDLPNARKSRTVLSWSWRMNWLRWNFCWSKNRPKTVITGTRLWQTSPPATIAVTTSKLPTTRKRRHYTTWAPTAQASAVPIKTGTTWVSTQPTNPDSFMNDSLFFHQSFINPNEWLR